nr:sigma-70 family RNA polymerase sigma factor [Eubacterium sp.]
MQTMDEIYREHSQMVYRYLLSLTKQADLAEELTQETFFQALKGINRFDGSCKVTTWLCAIAKNQWLNYLRKNPLTEQLTEASATVKSAESEVTASITRVDLMKKMHQIPEPGREILHLRLFGNLSFREIGEVMGKTENWARVTFYRAKEQLRKECREYE